MGHVGRWVEADEAFSKDFVGPITGNAFGADVPGDDIALQVEHVDRMVFHPLDEQVKSFLAGFQGLLRTPPPLHQQAEDRRRPQ